MKLTKDQVKNPLPKKIDEITLAFDVSTTETGFAFLMNGKPWIMKNGMPSFGSVNMVKQDMYTKRDGTQGLKQRTYATYGNKMFHGSYDQTMKLVNHLFQVIKPINDMIGQKLTEVKKVYVVMEISEIPNFGKYGQNLTTTRKLALYTGFVLGLVANVFDIAGFHLKNNTEVKLVSPQDWQQRVGFEKNEIPMSQQMSKYGMKYSKYQSLERANKLIKEWGYLQSITNDDTADAINLATVASEVEDNMEVRARNRKKTTNIKKFESDIAKLSNKIAEYKARAMTNKNDFVDNVVWANTVAKSELITPALKSKHTKYSKYDIEDTRAMDLFDFFTPAQKRKYVEFQERKAKAEKAIVSLRGAKVFNNGNN